jgi:hypothetical protein
VAAADDWVTRTAARVLPALTRPPSGRPVTPDGRTSRGQPQPAICGKNWVSRYSLTIGWLLGAGWNEGAVSEV